MNFAELNTEVQLIVKRPDKVDRIKSAVMDATLKLHTLYFYTRDIEELSIQFATPGTSLQFDPRTAVPRYRKIAYIRWLDPNTNIPGPLLEHVYMGDLVDYYGYYKTNIYYEAGDVIQIRTASEINAAQLGVYLFPNISSEADYSSWIATDYPWAIVYEAAAKLFAQIGNSAQAKDMKAEAMDYQRAIVESNTIEPNIRG